MRVPVPSPLLDEDHLIDTGFLVAAKPLQELVRSSNARALRAWTVVGTLLVLSVASPARAAGRLDAAGFECAWFAAPCVASNPPACPTLPPPPAGEGAFRPSHFSVAPVIVTVERSRWVVRSRIGGIRGV